MNKKWSMMVAGFMTFNAQPADNREKKDRRYTRGIGWTF